MPAVCRRHQPYAVRPYAGEKTLVVGCGNEVSVERHTKCYADRHRHPGAYTICNQDEFGSSLVGAFGYHDLRKLLPARAFDEIVFENVNLDPLEGNNAVSTLLYLLAPGGAFSIAWAEDCHKSWEPAAKRVVAVKDRLGGEWLRIDNYAEVFRSDHEYPFLYEEMVRLSHRELEVKEKKLVERLRCLRAYESFRPDAPWNPPPFPGLRPVKFVETRYGAKYESRY